MCFIYTIRLCHRTLRTFLFLFWHKHGIFHLEYMDLSQFHRNTYIYRYRYMKNNYAIPSLMRWMELLFLKYRRLYRCNCHRPLLFPSCRFQKLLIHWPIVLDYHKR